MQRIQKQLRNRGGIGAGMFLDLTAKLRNTLFSKISEISAKSSVRTRLEDVQREYRRLQISDKDSSPSCSEFFRYL